MHINNLCSDLLSEIAKYLKPVDLINFYTVLPKFTIDPKVLQQSDQIMSRFDTVQLECLKGLNSKNYKLLLMIKQIGYYRLMTPMYRLPTKSHYIGSIIIDPDPIDDKCSIYDDEGNPFQEGFEPYLVAREIGYEDSYVYNRHLSELPNEDQYITEKGIYFSMEQLNILPDNFMDYI